MTRLSQQMLYTNRFTMMSKWLAQYVREVEEPDGWELQQLRIMRDRANNILDRAVVKNEAA